MGLLTSKFSPSPLRLKSPPNAWRRVPAGGALIAIERGQPLKGLDTLDGETEPRDGHVLSLWES